MRGLLSSTRSKARGVPEDFPAPWCPPTGTVATTIGQHAQICTTTGDVTTARRGRGATNSAPRGRARGVHGQARFLLKREPCKSSFSQSSEAREHVGCGSPPCASLRCYRSYLSHFRAAAPWRSSEPPSQSAKRGLAARPGANVEASEPPCNFSAFVAGRRGLSIDEAQELIAHWLAAYEPHARQAQPLPAEADHDRDPGSLRNCA